MPKQPRQQHMMDNSHTGGCGGERVHREIKVRCWKLRSLVSMAWLRNLAISRALPSPQLDVTRLESIDATLTTETVYNTTFRLQ